MYHTRPKSPRGVYLTDRISENRLVAFVAEGIDAGLVAATLNDGLDYPLELNRLQRRVDELERELAFYKVIKPHVDAIAKLSISGAFA